MTSKTLIYKVAKFNNEANTATLQDLLTKALRKKKDALGRRQSLDDGQHRLINYNGPFNNMRVGEMFDYTAGHQQPTANFSETGETLELSSIPPGKNQEFLHSILYFGIRGNSLILSQSLTLRSLQFEDYVNWLLRETNLLSDTDYVAFCDQPPLDIEKQLLSTKGIEIMSPVDFAPSKASAKLNTTTKGISLKPKGLGWDIIKKALPKEIVLPTELAEKELIHDQSLEVTVYLSWSRTGKNDSTAMLDGISNQLRHVDTSLDYTIHTRSGKITRDEIKLRMPVSVSTKANGLIERTDMWNKMNEWLHELVASDKILPS